MDQRIRNTINEGILKLIIDVSSLEEVEEEAIEVVGEFSEKIEDMKLPMRGAIIATGEDAEMWNNLDGCTKIGQFAKTSKKQNNPSTKNLPKKTKTDHFLLFSLRLHLTV